MKTKTYYFYCRDCNERKPVAQESLFKPGVCVACYQTKPEYKVTEP